MRRIALALVFVLGVATPVMAKHEGGDHGHGQGPHHHDETAGPVQSSNTTQALPPGLAAHGTPHGLEKQNKTPKGWTKGKKRGWFRWGHKPE